jgi:hypothetical protein
MNTEPPLFFKLKAMNLHERLTLGDKNLLEASPTNRAIRVWAILQSKERVIDLRIEEADEIFSFYFPFDIFDVNRLYNLFNGIQKYESEY